MYIGEKVVVIPTAEWKDVLRPQCGGTSEIKVPDEAIANLALMFHEYFSPTGLSTSPPRSFKMTFTLLSR